MRETFVLGAAGMALTVAGLACSDSGPMDPARDTEPVDTLRFAQISAGSRHTCALALDGVALCWGLGGDGQLGSPSSSDPPWVPRRVETDLTFSDVSAAAQYTCGLSEGTVHCWGTGSWGSASSPRLIEGMDDVVEVESTFGHTCVRSAGGSVGCFGLGSAGQLGPGLAESQASSGSIVTVPGITDARRVAVGKNHSCALVADGRILCWGVHEAGQLGIGAGADSCPWAADGGPVPCSVGPAPVVADGPFVDIVAGWWHTCGLRADAGIECWGDDSQSELGVVSATESCAWSFDLNSQRLPCARVPVGLAGGRPFAALSRGTLHTCAIDPDASAYCWGLNSAGQLGSGGFTPDEGPGEVFGGHDWLQLSGGQLHSCGVTTSGAAFCWGNGELGQLGSATGFSPLPRLVVG